MHNKLLECYHIFTSDFRFKLNQLCWGIHNNMVHLCHLSDCGNFLLESGYGDQKFFLDSEPTQEEEQFMKGVFKDNNYKITYQSKK